MGLILITHDLGIAAEVADEVIVLKNGKIVEKGTLKDVFIKPKHKYTKELMNSIPGKSDQKYKRNDTKTNPILEIKNIRKEKLQATDYMANSDYTMPSYIKTWRQTLRDLPQNNTTESQYDTLLARETDNSKANYGQLTNSVWTQPTE